jgi:DNA replication licensing factor MCM5
MTKMQPPSRAQEEAEFREFASRPNVVDLIQARIAPQIFGAERIKEAVACLLFGGSRKVQSAEILQEMF